MSGSVSFQPAGFHAVTPYLRLKRAVQAIEFYQRAFGATEIMRLPMPDGRLGHAEIRIGDSLLMLADEFPEMGIVGPETLGNTTVSLMIYVPDVDAQVQRAVSAGATLTMPVADQFWGDRMGKVKDPFGHEWMIATHLEDMSPEEMGRRFQETMGGEE